MPLRVYTYESTQKASTAEPRSLRRGAAGFTRPVCMPAQGFIGATWPRRTERRRWCWATTRWSGTNMLRRRICSDGNNHVKPSEAGENGTTPKTIVCIKKWNTDSNNVTEVT